VLLVAPAVRQEVLVITLILLAHLDKVIKAAQLQIQLTMAQLWVAVVVLAHLVETALLLLAVMVAQELPLRFLAHLLLTLVVVVEMGILLLVQVALVVVVVLGFPEEMEQPIQVAVAGVLALVLVVELVVQAAAV
jgi:hypothetical protein